MKKRKNMQEMQNMQDIQNIQNMQKVQNMQGVQNVQEVQKMAKMPKISNMQNLPNLQKIPKKTIGALALILALSAALLSRVDAAIAIETDRPCSLTLETEGSYEELKELSIPTALYKVADIKENGDYQEREGFESLDLVSVSSGTTAREWEEKAAEARKLTREQGIQPDKEVPLENGSGKAEGLKTGLYLVAAAEVQSPYYTYSFSPYLISLPNNYYTEGESDAWVYDVTAGLKPEQQPRYGSLSIDKTLTSYNASLGEAVFVFQVEGEKDGEQVLSTAVSLAFDGTGTKSAVLDDLPAGATVTVTEVYSGASYRAASGTVQTVQIVAGEEQTVHAAFENEYNGGLKGGSGIVNHFQYKEAEGTWEWQQQADSSQE